MAKAHNNSLIPDDPLPPTALPRERTLSKIMRPEAREAWPRVRMFKMLDAARARRVIWISASAGSGKTTLASSYIELRNIRSVWYQIDPGDVDIGSFFHYLGLAAAAIAPGGDWRLPSPPHPLSRVEHFARRYMRELFQRLGPSGIVVLDNYQDADSELLDAVIRIAAAELPAGLNMIVLSRSPPPPAFSSLIVNGVVALIGENDIRLDFEETAGIAQHLYAAASDKVVKRWNDLARGWVAGLVLLAKSGGRLDLDGDAADIRNVLFDYFAVEVMSRLGDSEREMLLRASFLKTMTAEGVDQLVGGRNARELLQRLHAQNYFTSRRRDTYQFHPLFHEFLHIQASERLVGDELDDIRLRAAHISIAEGRLDDAIDLLIEARNWGELCRIIPAHAADVATQGRLTTLERWLLAIPAADRAAYPWIFFWLGVCRLPYDPDEASGHFATCIPLFEGADDLAGIAASWSKQIEAILHGWNDFSRLDEPLALMDRVISDTNLSVLPARLHFEVIQNALLAMQWRQPGHPRLPEIEQRACALLQYCGDPNLQAACSIYLSLYYCWGGRYHRVRTTVETLHTVMQYACLPPPMLAGAKVTECLTAWRVDVDFDRCLSEVDAALRLCAAADVHLWDTNLIGQAAAAALSKGDIPVAGETLERMRQRLPQSRRFDAGQYFLLAGWHAWAERRIDVAKEYVLQALDTFNAIGVPWGIGLMHAGYALVVGHEDPAYADHIVQATRLIQRYDSTEVAYPLLLAKINTAFHLENEQDTVSLIARLFAVGRENGIWNCYFWDTALMTKICAKALESGIETDYAIDLIRRRQLLPAEPALAPDNWPWRIKVRALGSLNVYVEGKPLATSAKGPAKPLALLQLLIAYGGTEVSERKIIDALWPDSDADAALRALDTTLHRLRKLLGDDNAVQLKNRRVSLDPARVWVDVLAFRRLIEHARGAASDVAMVLYRRAIDMYRGPFLDDEDGAPLIAERERLQREFMQTLTALGGLYEHTGKWESAIRCYEDGLAIDGLAENLYQRLMIAYRELRRPAEGLAVYQRCCQVLSSSFAVPPSAETEKISATLRQLL